MDSSSLLSRLPRLPLLILVTCALLGGLPLLAQGPQGLRLSDMGGTGDTDYEAVDPAVAYNSIDDEYLVVWLGDDDVGGLVDGEYEIFGQRLDGQGIPIGDNDFRISESFGTGSPLRDAKDPAIGFNPDRQEYLVVWSGYGLVGTDLEVRGQLIDHDGSAILDDFRISEVDDAGGAGSDPDVVYNPVAMEYLVVWVTAFPGEGYEVFGQRLDFAGNQVGVDDFQVSEMGAPGTAYQALEPAIAYNPIDDEYLVAWWGTDDVGGVVENEFEIFAQRLDGDGIEIGLDDFRISDLGGIGDPEYDAVAPDVVFNPDQQEYLVVWHGDDNVGGQQNNELEVFAQRVNRSGVEVGINDHRITAAGGLGTGTARYARDAVVAWNPDREQYLVVFAGNYETCETEIHAQVLDAQGLEVDDDRRISQIGPDADCDYYAIEPWTDGEMIVWQSNDVTLALGEWEIFGRRRADPPLFADGFETGTTEAWR